MILENVFEKMNVFNIQILMNLRIFQLSKRIYNFISEAGSFRLNVRRPFLTTNPGIH